MVSTGTLCAVKRTAHSLTSQPSSASATRRLSARTNPWLEYQSSSSGMSRPAPPVAGSSAAAICVLYLPLVSREENGLMGRATTLGASSERTQACTPGSA